MNRKCGHIVAVSSATGKIGNVLCTSYSAAKFALTGLLETLREEVSFVLELLSLCKSSYMSFLDDIMFADTWQWCEDYHHYPRRSAVIHIHQFSSE